MRVSLYAIGLWLLLGLGGAHAQGPQGAFFPGVGTGSSSGSNNLPVCYTTGVTGSNLGARAAACYANLPATGGIIDARGDAGPQSFPTGIDFNKPILLLLGAGTYTFNGPLRFLKGSGTYCTTTGQTSATCRFPGMGVVGMGPNQTYLNFPLAGWTGSYISILLGGSLTPNAPTNPLSVGLNPNGAYAITGLINVGDTTFTATTPANVSTLQAGDLVNVGNTHPAPLTGAWAAQQYERKTVVSANAGTGVVTVAEPFRHAINDTTNGDAGYFQIVSQELESPRIEHLTIAGDMNVTSTNIAIYDAETNGTHVDDVTFDLTGAGAQTEPWEEIYTSNGSYTNIRINAAQKSEWATTLNSWFENIDWRCKTGFTNAHVTMEFGTEYTHVKNLNMECGNGITIQEADHDVLDGVTVTATSTGSDVGINLVGSTGDEFGLTRSANTLYGVAIAPGTSAVWTGSHTYNTASCVSPTANAGATGMFFCVASCSGGCQSGVGEPSWPTTVGNTVIDNQVTWYAAGHIHPAQRNIFDHTVVRSSNTGVYIPLSISSGNLLYGLDVDSTVTTAVNDAATTQIRLWDVANTEFAFQNAVAEKLFKFDSSATGDGAVATFNNTTATNPLWACGIAGSSGVTIGSTTVSNGAFYCYNKNTTTVAFYCTPAGRCTYPISPLTYPTALRPAGFTFSNLSTSLVANGDMGFCTDCTNTKDDSHTAGAVCAGSGHGALAIRENGAAYACY